VRLTITTNEGTVLGVIDALETWNLDKPNAQANFMAEVQSIVRGGAKVADSEGEYVPSWSEVRASKKGPAMSVELGERGLSVELVEQPKLF
jgi:hypothetical protein